MKSPQPERRSGHRMSKLDRMVEFAISAYRGGAFPMSVGGKLGFYACDPRWLFLFDRFYMPKTIGKLCRRKPFEIRTDTAFDDVVRGCRSGRDEWISAELAAVYSELFKRGHAHSVEAWKDGKLAGGLYGTHFGAAFLAESMYHSVTGASNVCVVHLMEHLKTRGFHFCDIQYPNPHTLRFHPVPIPARDFDKILRRALKAKAEF